MAKPAHIGLVGVSINSTNPDQSQEQALILPEGTASSVAQLLFQLQLEQLQHDEEYHREICRLTVHDRLNHMALHFAKYTGKVAKLCEEEDTEKFARVVTDIFIISLSSANTLNLRLSDKINECLDIGHGDLMTLGYILAARADISSLDQSWLLLTMAKLTGQMAKGCESIDHLEDYSFREKIIESVVGICKTVLIVASFANLDLTVETQMRLASVKERLIFHGYL